MTKGEVLAIYQESFKHSIDSPSSIHSSLAEELSEAVDPQVEHLHGVALVRDLGEEPQRGPADDEELEVLPRLLLEELGLRELGLLGEGVAVLDERRHHGLPARARVPHGLDLLPGELLRGVLVHDVPVVLDCARGLVTL